MHKNTLTQIYYMKQMLGFVLQVVVLSAAGLKVVFSTEWHFLRQRSSNAGFSSIFCASRGSCHIFHECANNVCIILLIHIFNKRKAFSYLTRSRLCAFVALVFLVMSIWRGDRGDPHTRRRAHVCVWVILLIFFVFSVHKKSTCTRVVRREKMCWTVSTRMSCVPFLIVPQTLDELGWWRHERKVACAEWS